MTSTEDVVRAATRAYGETVTEIRPLDLTRPAPRARRPRRFPAWVAPVTAAAAVIALAISLVLVRGIQNGPVVPPAASSSPGAVAPIAGVPEYYVTLHQANPSAPSGLVIGDTFSGARLAAIAPPRGSAFAGVTGAADDRTFVVSTMPVYKGLQLSLPVTWYLLRIAPGGTPGYRLTRLAIPDMEGWAVQAIALSGSGDELAMTLLPAARHLHPGGWELRTYSVATGKLLGSWSLRGTATLSTGTVFPGAQDQPLSWVDGDRAVAFQAFDPIGAKSAQESERLLDVAAGSGDLIVDSQVIWATLITSGDQPMAHRCYPSSPRVTPDGKTVLCVSGPVGATSGRGHVTLEWLTIPTTGVSVPRVLYEVAVDVFSGSLTVSAVLWAANPGGPLIAFWSGHPGTPSGTHFGVVSHGQFHPLPAVPIAPYGEAPAVAW